jgi:hypothetical protein
MLENVSALVQKRTAPPPPKLRADSPEVIDLDDDKPKPVSTTRGKMLVMKRHSGGNLASVRQPEGRLTEYFQVVGRRSGLLSK